MVEYYDAHKRVILDESRFTKVEHIINFIRKETVLTIAAILAVISMFFVKPGMEYVGYIDFRTLGILLSLMIIMEGFKRTGLFDSVGNWLLLRTKNVFSLVTILVFLCFFFSMFITNDVALLTFVPFSLIVLKKCGRENLLIPVVALQTIAANLGSMLTPIGNPQNLYLYEKLGVSVGDFVMILLPYTLVTGVMLIAVILCMKGKKEKVNINNLMSTSKTDQPHNAVLAHNIVLGVLFVFALLVVAHIIPWYFILGAVLIAVFIIDKRTLVEVDYALIFTFIAFFILIGNLGNIEAIKSFLTSVVKGREVLVSIAASQFISNVPATLLLSEFTQDLRSLLVGVNFGGLGTLIASMASLISYKILAHNHNDIKGRYIIRFSILNIIFLVVLILFRMMIG